jgi:iron-sulfur cluster assembly protein
MENIVTIGSASASGETHATPQVPIPAEGGLQVTANAVRRIRVILAKEGISTDEGGLRLGVKGGGCSGLSYAVGFDAKSRERDNIFTFEDVRVFIDPKSFVYLKGMTLDYEETLMRQGFNFLNPNSSRSCGCGSSFSV